MKTNDSESAPPKVTVHFDWNHCSNFGITVQIIGIGVQIVGIGVFFVEIDDLEQLFIFIGIRGGALGFEAVAFNDAHASSTRCTGGARQGG